MLNHFLVFLSTVHLSASLVSMAFLNILNLRFILSLICLLIHEEDTLPYSKYRRTCIKERGNKVATSNNKKVLIDFLY